MKDLKAREFNYVRTLDPSEVKKFVKSAETISKEAKCMERGIHDGGCPFPIKMSFWSKLFSFL
ncbi:MAG: hypothetical protein AUJ32_02395 [Parcubacteria group bacterium CG1_02_40_82]|uniref:Uncharacterized protein n=3 Tax=Candidatus Portnoyibacteriota TaxID=1817913 RepID=A0A2M7YPL8_9BACT|nr:MAG: hypothetical protein AUJ32_02395 [Parcubacteria group bacterium CG1_02_40_82]PIQ75021.1 MAG: hypothetical protein COV84_03430 [Candidatus Portnoybacteria bacterium CG11_big_fil_rev_8_21_14_0_20_40_15]PIY75071.1 MAG: hypothetical protein COY85_01345 [Candidatus Portnoybacteria bacterium CG_4_10_14_0_8_um_filter_40_50]PJA64941.1 MAG: hypothetical protein CO159_00355 [Candidatus Portnoybacteria bacterium CG_4_9_14_3_um_filter_40_10]